jgi:hypothetical protein
MMFVLFGDDTTRTAEAVPPDVHADALWAMAERALVQSPKVLHLVWNSGIAVPPVDLPRMRLVRSFLALVLGSWGGQGQADKGQDSRCGHRGKGLPFVVTT